MPLPKGTKYAYKKGTKVRLAFNKGKVIEAKNMETGATHTSKEFNTDRMMEGKMTSKKEAEKAMKKKMRGK